MCRLFAYVAKDSSSSNRELGAEGIESFVSLARLHGDGWGWAGVSNLGEQPKVIKSPLSAAVDPNFQKTISLPSHAAMMHLRWATMGLPVEMCNAHPFEANGVSFEHNGSLKPIDRVRAMLRPETLARMTGETDSEMYFALIQEQREAGIELAEATRMVARRLREAFPLSSLNAILLDAHQLVVVHASATSELPREDVDEINELGGLPDEHNEDYFSLRWKRSSEGTLMFSSTGVAGDGWQNLPAESVTQVSLADLTMSTVPLAS